ncbi:efflux RND transporter periplasmic adaptor subunit [Psychromonas sp.]|uniref:efflux RND transporter periplasmic adaptor subunit n=1 Tax=Psychromonas sp. TaxID=1884585 RepID=UPI003568211D
MEKIIIKGLPWLCTLMSFNVLSASQLPTVDCVIIPSRSAELSAPVAGVVAAVHKSLSHTVEKGDLVAELNTEVEKSAITLAKIKTNLSAEHNAEKANLKFYNLQLQRITKLSGNELASLRDLDEAVRLKENAFWGIEQIRQNREIRKQELQHAQAQLKYKFVYAPFKGVIAKQYKFPGEYVDGQPIAKIVDIDTLHIEAIYPMEHYPLLKKGMFANVYPETDQTRGYQAKIDVIDPIGDVASGTFGVRLSMDNSARELPAGIKCFLEIESDSDESGGRNSQGEP